MVTTRSNQAATITQVMSPRREAGSPARSARSSRTSDELQLPARADEAAPDDAPATSQASSTRVEQQLELLLAQFGTVMATLTNQQQMQNVPVDVSTPRPQRQLTREFSAARIQPLRVPTPYGPRRGNPSAENVTAGASTRQGEPPRTPRSSEVAAQPVQTEAGTDTTNETMVGGHRCTRCMNQSGHVQLNARLTDDNYQTWRVEICSILDVAHLLDPIMERETMADQRNEGQHGCFKQRLRVAQRELTMGLSQELQMRFTGVIQRADPILLWRTLEDHFDNHPGVNSVFLKRDMLNRRLQRDERLDDYIRDIDDYQQRLRRANKQLPEQEVVSILLSNTVGVYPAVVNKHEVRIGRGEPITWEQAIERLRLADHSRQETELQQGRGGGGRAVQRDVAYVGGRGNGHNDGGGRRSSSSGQARGNYNRNSRRSRSRSSSPRGRNKRQKSKSSSRARDDIVKRKAKTKCNTCGEQGHWSGDPGSASVEIATTPATTRTTRRAGWSTWLP